MHRPAGRLCPPTLTAGFGLLEILAALTLVALLVALAVPGLSRHLERSREASLAADMASIELAIERFQLINNALPASLADVGMDTLEDPWGNGYRYLNLATAAPGQARKDRFLVPLNTDYDLYSMGPDGASQTPLTAAASRDDYIRANDGRFHGWASHY